MRKYIESARQNRFKVSRAILFMDSRAIDFSKIMTTTTVLREARVHVGNSVSPSLPNEPCHIIEFNADDKAVIRGVENSFNMTCKEYQFHYQTPPISNGK